MEATKRGVVEKNMPMMNFDSTLENNMPMLVLVKSLGTDALVEIFKKLDVFESNLSVAHFAENLKKDSKNISWETLDFSMLKSDFVKISNRPYVWVSSRSDNILYNLLFIVLNLSQEKTKTLIFHHNLFLSNDQFVYTAMRCPLARRLVFASWNRIKKVGIQRAIRVWKNLESMTMPSMKNPNYVFEGISKNCKNFRELEVMGCIEPYFAYSLVTNLPKLKVLSLRCCGLVKDALILILYELKHLEVLNISHSCYVTPKVGYKADGYNYVGDIDDPDIFEKASKLRQFHICMKESCIMCKRTKDDEGNPRWFRYELGIFGKKMKLALLHFEIKVTGLSSENIKMAEPLPRPCVCGNFYASVFFLIVVFQ